MTPSCIGSPPSEGNERALIVAWLRDDAEQTEWEAAIIVAKLNYPNERTIQQWAQLVATKRGIADAIERGDHMEKA